MPITPKTLTVLESSMLLDALLPLTGPLKKKLRGMRNYTIALLMLDAGLRVGEVVRLSEEDLYYAYAAVQSVTICPAIAKNKMERTIPLSGRIQRAIEMMQKSWWSAGWGGEGDYAFTKIGSPQRLSTRQVERIIRCKAESAIGRPVHPHVLRHTFASKLMRTVNARVVQELLGHKSITSTQVYTHPNQEDLKSAIGTLEISHAESNPEHTMKCLADRIANGLDTRDTDRDM